MTTYIVTFEVNDASRKSALKEKLKQYDGFCPIHDNCWAILSDQTPAQIQEFLGKALASQDRIFVIRSGTHAAWRNTYGKKNSNWLKERL
jgi:hypothetical protein